MVKTKQKKYEIDMCNGALFPKIIMFTIPLICQSVLQLLFNAADIVVVGRYAGDNALAAVSSNGSLINLLINLFIGLSVGSNVLVAKCYGAKKENDVSEAVHTSIALSIISGIWLTIVGIIFGKMILNIMNVPDDVIGLSTLYIRIYFLGMTSTMVYNFGSAVLRAVGDTKRPLYYLLFSGVVNVILNLIFVIIFHMSVAGVAYATVISQTISAILVIRCLIHEKGAIRLYPRKIKIHKDKMYKIIRVGIPAGIQGMVFSLSNVVIQSSVNSFGSDVIAGNGAAQNLEGFVYVAMNSCCHAAVSFTSQNIGAGKYKRADKIAVYCIGLVSVIGLLLGNGLVAMGPWLLRIYSRSATVIGAGRVRLAIIGTTYALCGIMDVLVGCLRGRGYSVIPMIVSLIGACGFRLIWLATVFKIDAYHSVRTVYASYPISWTITLIVHVITLLIVRRKISYKNLAENL